MKKNYSASITVFLSLSFVLIAALILTITESARTIAQKYYMQTALNSAMESLFSEFHRPLWENYRIYALEFRDDDLLKEELQSFIKPYSDARNLFPAKIEKDGFSFTGRGLLSESHYFEEEMMNEGDNPPIGIVLCADKSDSIVKYTLSKNETQVFASKYKAYLPSEEELLSEIKKEYNILKQEEELGKDE